MTDANPTAVVRLADGAVACMHCTLFQLCLPPGLARADLELLDGIIKRRRGVARGEHVFRSGDGFRSIYAAKSGSFKIYAYTADGREQIAGLHLPGELFGMDAISSGRHCCSAVALERSSVCEMPYDRFEELGTRVPSLMRHMVRIMSREISRDKRAALFSKHSAEGRLAAFLVSLSERFQERGFSKTEFRLSMSRVEIGNYLGLADETVSRLFRRFQETGLLSADRRNVRLLDLERLRATADGHDVESAARGRHARHPGEVV